MLKRILILSIIILFTIQARCHDSREDKREKQLQSLLVWVWAINQPQFTISPCIEYMKPLNIAYGQSEYWPRFHNDNKQYNTIIRGNSTMDISCRYDNFLSDTTQCVAVGGNTLCDMETQRPAINTTNPYAIVISSGGGNDIIQMVTNERDITEAQIVNNGKYLIDQTRSEFPGAKIVFIPVHPTLESALNAVTPAINSNLEVYVNSLSNTCVVDIMGIFGKTAGDMADESQMLDSIHYNITMAFSVKSAIGNDCGVNL